MSDAKNFTGRQRRLKTRSSVKWGDQVARAVIGIGGVGTIIAVLLICFFLVWEVIPLFTSATLQEDTAVAHSTATTSPRTPMSVQLADDGLIGWEIDAERAYRAFCVGNGQAIETSPAVNALFAQMTGIRVLPEGNSSLVVVGTRSGRIRIGVLGSRTSRVTFPAEIPKSLETDPLVVADRVWIRRSDDSADVVEVSLETLPEYSPGGTRPLAFVDVVQKQASGISKAVAYFTASIDQAGECRLAVAAKKKTGAEMRVEEFPAFSVLDQAGHVPDFMRLSGLGEYLYVGWKDGTVRWYEIRDPSTPRMLKEFDAVDTPDGKLTAMEMLEGRVSLLVGDSLGRVGTWFPVNLDAGRVTLVKGHEFTGWTSPIRMLATTSRNRTFLAIDEAGDLKILYATNDRSLVDVPRLPGEKYLAAAFSPRQTQLLTLSDQGMKSWKYDAPHADVSLKGLFRPVWYESEPRPTYSWSANSTEPKFGLIPLIFGTLKATFYSMLIGAPLALMAAIFTAEFLHPNVKARVKPVIELMASLPSVVLGYVAGMIFAPLLSDILPQAIASIVFVPFGLLCGAYAWQLLPQRWTLQAGTWRLVCIAVCILPGLALAAATGEWFERLLFGKSIKGWLTEDILTVGQKSSAFGGWFLLLIPLSALVVIWFGGMLIDDYLRNAARNTTRRQAALCHFGKFVVMSLATLALAAVAAWLLTGFHADLRSVDSEERYSRSNSLLVGITMGFAIIPLIYTIADDALSTVPNHLRSASLGAGATPWQTAVRIVVPTATSGLFSALMIGLGRAVGETMIVLMTVGNTPIMDFNIFNGFQTLSAAIAVGLTEAPHGGSQYRVLFLAAFTLFVITFIINTIAESVRQRFRKRAYEL